MLSVLIITQNSEKRLAHTLSALVPAVVDGLLRRVIVVDQGSSDETRLVAEGAGCALYGGDELSVALGTVRTQWLMILQPGAILSDVWTDAVRRHMEAGSSAARFTLAHEQRFGPIGRLFAKKPSLDAGLLVKVDALKPVPSSRSALEDLPVQLKPLRLPPIITPPETTKGGA